MKSEYFKNTPSQIRGNREKPREDQVNWDQIVYLILLFLLLLAAGYFSFERFFVVRGDGQVFTNRYTVRFPVDVRLMDMYVSEGDSVLQSDSLFSFAVSYRSDNPNEVAEELQEMKEDIHGVNAEIAEQRTRLKSLQEELEFYQNEKDLIQKEIKLGVGSVNELRDVEENLVELRGDIALTRQRVSSLFGELETIKSRHQDTYGFTLVGEMAGVDTERSRQNNDVSQVFRTPVAGVVERINIESSELAIRSESILSVRRKASEIAILAIFQRDELDQLSMGQKMKVEFDNGVTSRGVISNFEVPQPLDWDSFSRTDDAINKRIIVELKPVNEEEFQVWESNSNLGVRVSTTTF